MKMHSMGKMIAIAAISSVGVGSGPLSTATAADFFEDFEGDLSQWVGKSGEPHHGIVVADPLRPGNSVLTFTALNWAGDMFSSEISVISGRRYVLSFEYLGVPGYGPPDNLGGFIGFAEDTPSFHRWLAGTVFCCGAEDAPLIDDGQWRTYSLEFDPFRASGGTPRSPSNNTIRVMLEDFAGTSGGVPGDVAFDNILLTTYAVDLEIEIDIKPGSDSNSINLRGKGVVSVAILTTSVADGDAADFDVMDVDQSTLSMAGAGARTRGRSGRIGSFEDVDGDGDLDLVVQFYKDELDLFEEDTEAVLEGQTFDGTPIHGSDSILVRR